MPRILVRPLGGVDPAALRYVEDAIAGRFGDVRLLDPEAEPAEAFDARRKQWSSVAMLKRVMANAPVGDDKILAVTERDLFIPMLTFVFGQAQIDGRFALVSLARLRQEFYGLPTSRDLLHRRARKECFHELGHAFGLLHCADPGCPMSLSTGISQVDAKGEDFCALCWAALGVKAPAREGASL
jgi:archaemetzincin